MFFQFTQKRVWRKFTNCYFLMLLSCTNGIKISDSAYVIEHVSVIDPIDGFQATKHIVVEQQSIAMILNPEVRILAAEDKRINGKDKYIIPGLWDAHVHFAFNSGLATSMGRLFVGHGITSVRDTGGPIDIVEAAKKSGITNPYRNPTTYIAGPLIDGTPNVYNNSSPAFPLLSIENKDTFDLVKQVESLVAKKVDFLKAYEMLSETQFKALSEIAQKNELKITGHIPLSMNLFSAVQHGLNGMEHLRNLELSVANNAEQLQKERVEILKNPNHLTGGALRSFLHNKQRMAAINAMSEEKLAKAAQLLATNQVWQTPTLFLYRNFTLKSFLAPDFRSELKKLPKIVQQEWIDEIESTDKTVNATNLLYSDWMMETVGTLHDYEVPFMAGTDTPIGFLIPGKSLHNELELLVQSGFSNLEALQTATINPARFFELEDQLGRIKKGYVADLVILDENPLESISNTQKIHAVVKHGRFLSRATLDSLLYEMD